MTAPIAVGDVVLDAALAAGINLAHQCRSGSCATCVGKVVSGETETVAGRAPALLSSEIAAGMRLCCSLIACGDVTVELPYASTFTLADQASSTAGEVLECLPLSASVWKLVLKPDPSFDFQPGQYLRLQVPGTDAWRSYSIASSRDATGRIELVIKKHPGGAMGEYLTRARPGDAIDVEGPFGAFLLSQAKGPTVFIAGGTGLGPILPMLDQLRLRGGRAHPVTLAFSCSQAEDLFLLDELELREYWMPLLDLRVGVSRSTAEWEGLRGNPLALVDDESLLAAAAIHVCGSPGLVEATRQRCARLAIDPAKIRSEQFILEVTLAGHPKPETMP